jgi:hypothetical protein
VEYYILKYLIDQGVVTPDLDVYVNLQPDTDDTITSIYSSTAPYLDYMHHYDTDATGIQFLTRSTNQTNAYKLARSIHRNLKGLTDLTIDDATDQNGDTLDELTIVDVHVVNKPVFLELDEDGRVTFTSNYMVESNEGNQGR